jgi:hypothetical protein
MLWDEGNQELLLDKEEERSQDTWTAEIGHGRARADCVGDSGDGFPGWAAWASRYAAAVQQLTSKMLSQRGNTTMRLWAAS